MYGGLEARKCSLMLFGTLIQQEKEEAVGNRDRILSKAPALDQVGRDD